MLYDPKWTPPVEVPVIVKKKKVKAKSKRKTWRTLMLNAAAVLEKQGWIRGNMFEPNKGFCTLGALRRADVGRNDLAIKATVFSTSYTMAITKLEDHLTIANSVHLTMERAIVDWNDSRVMDGETVIRTLREVAASK